MFLFALDGQIGDGFGLEFIAYWVGAWMITAVSAGIVAASVVYVTWKAIAVGSRSFVDRELRERAGRETEFPDLRSQTEFGTEGSGG